MKAKPGERSESTASRKEQGFSLVRFGGRRQNTKCTAGTSPACVEPPRAFRCLRLKPCHPTSDGSSHLPRLCTYPSWHTTSFRPPCIQVHPNTLPQQQNESHAHMASCSIHNVPQGSSTNTVSRISSPTAAAAVTCAVEGGKVQPSRAADGIQLD